jgi:hypothetical protein
MGLASAHRADGRDRTGDIRFTRAVLYQLSYVGMRAHRIAGGVGRLLFGGRSPPAVGSFGCERIETVRLCCGRSDRLCFPTRSALLGGCSGRTGAGGD